MLAATAFTIATLAALPTSTAQGAVPAGVQAALIVKVAAYDRNMPSRVGDIVHVLIVAKSGDAASDRSAAQMKTALASFSTIVDRPHDEDTWTYSTATLLAREAKKRHIAIVYVATGFDDAEVRAIGVAFEGADIFSVGADAAYVPQGVVMSVDLVSGKSELMFDLRQARLQNVDVKAEALKLMKVYR